MSRDNRTNAYTVRYNDDEDFLIRAAAEAHSLEVGSWIRMVSVSAARTKVPDAAPGTTKKRKPGGGAKR